MGIFSKFWGTHLWVFLHSVAHVYPDKPTPEEISDMRNFMHSLADVIPCRICKVEFTKILNEGASGGIKPFGFEVLRNRKTFTLWLYKVHNYVNAHKPLEEGETRKTPPSYKNVIAFYNMKLTPTTPKLKP